MTDLKRFFSYRAPGKSPISIEVDVQSASSPMRVARFLVEEGLLDGKECTCCGARVPLAAVEWRELVQVGDAAPIEEPWRALTRTSRAAMLPSENVH